MKTPVPMQPYHLHYNFHFSHVMNATQTGEEDAYISSSGTHTALVWRGEQEEGICWTNIYSDMETILPYYSLYMSPTSANSCLLSLQKWQVMPFLKAVPFQAFFLVCVCVCVSFVCLIDFGFVFISQRKQMIALFCPQNYLQFMYLIQK